MLFLVEGLNCAGKSTFIKKVPAKKLILKTSWLNPLINKDCEPNYALGSYETIYRTLASLGILDSNSVFFDRTWISAHAYGSMDKTHFLRLAEIYNSDKVAIIYLGTSVGTCWKRWEALDRKEDKPYVVAKLGYWKEVKERMDIAMEFLNTIGFSIHRIEGE